MYHSAKKAFWDENPIIGEIPIVLPFMPSFKMFSENDDAVIKELYWSEFTGWELTSLKIWHRLALAAGKGIILDIGAYSGIYSLVASVTNPDSSIMAFDIQQKCLDRLQKNISINTLENISYKLAACSDRDEVISFSFREAEGILCSVASIVSKEENTTSANVEAIKLDNFLTQTDQMSNVKLIKIDVEDAEVSTLAGLQNTITTSQPDILIEINNSGNIRKVVGLLPDHYNIYSIDEDRYRIKRQGMFFKRFENSRNFLVTAKNIKIVKGLLA